MFRKRTLLIALVSLSLTVIFAWILLPPERDVRYTITDLGTPRGDVPIPISINNRGHVLGVACTLTGSRHAFLWTPERGYQAVGAFRPYGMNERDEVVGGEHMTHNHACLWTPTDGLIDLGAFGDASSHAYGINNHCEVVGWSRWGRGGESLPQNNEYHSQTRSGVFPHS